MPEDVEINSITTPPPAVTGVPQFSTAEYAHIPGTERCKLCGNIISGEYYRINNLMACSNCATQAQDGQPKDSHIAFMRSLLFGIGAAILGMALYATVVIATGWSIGYLALAVGWLVAKAIMKGSNGIGGIRYQVIAVLLTYLAISMSIVPIAISYALKHGSLDLGRIAGRLVIYGIASPFIALQSPGHGILGLIILFVGLSIAFRITAAKPLAVDGPFSVTA